MRHPSPTTLLAAAHVSRHFDGRVAVRDLSLTVAAGEVVALLGPNGAGKTTTLRLIAGLIPPTTGSIAVEGPTGLLTEAPGLWERLSVRLNLETYARIHQLPDPDRHVDRVLELVGADDRANDPAGQLSKGLKQRVAIARTLLHDPRVLLLDEPTSGLDPRSARDVRDLILRLKGDGRAVLVSTHNLTEAEELADRIGVLKTELLALDRPEALRGARAGSRVTITVEGDAAPWLSTVANVLGTGMAAGEAQGSALIVPLTSRGQIPQVVRALVEAGAAITRVDPDERTLEAVYLDLVEGT